MARPVPSTARVQGYKLGQKEETKTHNDTVHELRVIVQYFKPRINVRHIFIVSWKDIYPGQLSITALNTFWTSIVAPVKGERLGGSFAVCPLIDRKWKAGAAGVIIPDITSRTIKLAAPGHAEKGGTSGVVREGARRASSRLIYWCDFIMRWNDTIIFYQQCHRWTSEIKEFMRRVVQLRSLFTPILCIHFFKW